MTRSSSSPTTCLCSTRGRASATFPGWTPPPSRRSTSSRRRSTRTSPRWWGRPRTTSPAFRASGPKTAAKWINLYGGLEGVLENLDAIGGKVGDALRENVEDVKRNRRLNRLHTDLELPVTLDDLAEPRPDEAALEQLFDELEFKTIRTRLFALYGSEDLEPAERESIDAPEYRDPRRRSGTGGLPGRRRRAALRGRRRPGARAGSARTPPRWPSSVTTPPPTSTSPRRTPPPKTSWRTGCGIEAAPKVMHGYKAALKALSSRGLGLEGRGG